MSVELLSHYTLTVLGVSLPSDSAHRALLGSNEHAREAYAVRRVELKQTLKLVTIRLLVWEQPATDRNKHKLVLAVQTDLELQEFQHRIAVRLNKHTVPWGWQFDESIAML
jgi:hypothetical protein